MTLPRSAVEALPRRGRNSTAANTRLARGLAKTAPWSSVPSSGLLPFAPLDCPLFRIVLGNPCAKPNVPQMP